MPHITYHGAKRLAQRAGVDAAKLERLIGTRTLPDGKFIVPSMGTVIIKGGRIITMLDDEMVTTHTQRR